MPKEPGYRIAVTSNYDREDYEETWHSETIYTSEAEAAKAADRINDKNGMYHSDWMVAKPADYKLRKWEP